MHEVPTRALCTFCGQISASLAHGIKSGLQHSTSRHKVQSLASRSNRRRRCGLRLTAAPAHDRVGLHGALTVGVCWFTGQVGYTKEPNAAAGPAGAAVLLTSLCCCGQIPVQLRSLLSNNDLSTGRCNPMSTPRTSQAAAGSLCGLPIAAPISHRRRKRTNDTGREMQHWIQNTSTAPPACFRLRVHLQGQPSAPKRWSASLRSAGVHLPQVPGPCPARKQAEYSLHLLLLAHN